MRALTEKEIQELTHLIYRKHQGQLSLEECQRRAAALVHSWNQIFNFSVSAEKRSLDRVVS